MSQRSIKRAILRGFGLHCPNCGQGPMFAAFMKVAPACSTCREELHHQRADDAPPYFTMLIVGHIVVPLVLVVEKIWRPDLWIHAAIFMPATLALTLLLMPRVKGAIVGWQWALRMHGFGE
jgi:uncharacterized protein (DUF983 family)